MKSFARNYTEAWLDYTLQMYLYFFTTISVLRECSKVAFWYYIPFLQKSRERQIRLSDKLHENRDRRRGYCNMSIFKLPLFAILMFSSSSQSWGESFWELKIKSLKHLCRLWEIQGMWEFSGMYDIWTNCTINILHSILQRKKDYHYWYYYVLDIY